MAEHQRVTREQQLYNAETPLSGLAAAITPQSLFYVRNHMPMPQLDPSTWQLVVDGAVARRLRLRLSDITSLPQQTLAVTLECAGNGRAHMARPAEGIAWQFGATSSAEFTGTPLHVVLEQAGLKPETIEVLFVGADQGEYTAGRLGHFERSLPVDAARQPDILLAWAMNGVPLEPEHGFPLRLVVPGWYGMASVKWLSRISALTKPFQGYYQRERYIYVGEDGTPDGAPVTRIRVRAVIAQPVDGSHLRRGPITVKGTAWSGDGPVRRVQVSIDGGQSWLDGETIPPASRYAPTQWHLSWMPLSPGAYTLLARAEDESGSTQPQAPLWNAYGYGNNAAQSITVTIG